MSTNPFVIERIFNAPVSKVWKAISNNDDMKKWYFDIAEFKPIVGFKFSFTGGSKEQQYIHLCKVTEVINEKKLTYSWSYEGYEGYSEVTFELLADGEKTKLKLTHVGLESFPKNNKDFAPESFAKGWTHIINESLKKYVEEIAH